MRPHSNKGMVGERERERERGGGGGRVCVSLTLLHVMIGLNIPYPVNPSKII